MINKPYVNVLIGYIAIFSCSAHATLIDEVEHILGGGSFDFEITKPRKILKPIISLYVLI